MRRTEWRQALDTLTHAISGAVLARATAGQQRANTLSLKERTVVGGLAAAAPDIDFVLTLFGQVIYLEQHRGVTHSVLLLPAWAWLLAVLFAWLGGRRYGWKAYYGVCALAIGIHIIGDMITSFGTQILAPFSNWAPGWNLTFILDPWFSALLLGGFLLSLYWRPRLAATGTLVVLAAVLLLQYSLQRTAVDVAKAYAEQHSVAVDAIKVYPQPLSWFNWKVVVVDDETYHLARLNLLLEEPRPDPGESAFWLRRIWASYEPVERLQWERYRKFGRGGQDPLAREAWAQDDFAFYRWFADLPLVYAVQTMEEKTCVWFYDLQFKFPALTPAFRYGMCRGRGDDWIRHRLSRGGPVRA